MPEELKEMSNQTTMNVFSAILNGQSYISGHDFYKGTMFEEQLPWNQIPWNQIAMSGLQITDEMRDGYFQYLRSLSEEELEPYKNVIINKITEARLRENEYHDKSEILMQMLKELDTPLAKGESE